MKINTPTSTNYCYNIKGYFFAVRKKKITLYNNKGYWMIVAYRSNMLCTDNYICIVEEGFNTKKDAKQYLYNIMKTTISNFFHNIIN
jgi:hypothetical protein